MNTSSWSLKRCSKKSRRLSAKNSSGRLVQKKYKIFCTKIRKFCASLFWDLYPLCTVRCTVQVRAHLGLSWTVYNVSSLSLKTTAVIIGIATSKLSTGLATATTDCLVSMPQSLCLESLGNSCHVSWLRDGIQCCENDNHVAKA